MKSAVEKTNLLKISSAHIKSVFLWFGLIALMVLVTTPLSLIFKKKQSPYLVTFLLFWLLTISHSSMRIAAPAFIYGLALIHIIHAKPRTIIHRK